MFLWLVSFFYPPECLGTTISNIKLTCTQKIQPKHKASMIPIHSIIWAYFEPVVQSLCTLFRKTEPELGLCALSVWKWVIFLWSAVGFVSIPCTIQFLDHDFQRVEPILTLHRPTVVVLIRPTKTQKHPMRIKTILNHKKMVFPHGFSRILHNIF